MSGTLERPRRAKGESMAEYSARREDYVATHRDVRNGNRTKLAQHDDALAYLLTPVAPDLDEEIAEARQERPELFSQSNPELDALRTQVSQLEANTTALRARIADLESRPPEVREVRVEVPMLSPDPVKHMIPEEIRNLMQEGESLSSAKRRLTELLWVEQAELRNLRGTDRENLKREAEIERLLGLFARLGEI